MACEAANVQLIFKKRRVSLHALTSTYNTYKMSRTGVQQLLKLNLSGGKFKMCPFKNTQGVHPAREGYQ